MKIVIFTLCFVAIFCCLINSIDAGEEHEKQLAGRREMCPEHKTRKECIDYAKYKSKKFNYCNGYTVGNTFNYIEWQGCPNIHCGGNAKWVGEDLSKPYPDCCEHCVE